MKEALGDDVVLLCKDSINTYWFFSFSCNDLECSIGRLKHENDAEVLSLFKEFVISSFDNVVEFNASKLAGNFALRWNPTA